MNLIRLLLIYLVGTILHGIQFLIVYLFILFFVELILAKISSHLLLNWKNKIYNIIFINFHYF